MGHWFKLLIIGSIVGAGLAGISSHPRADWHGSGPVFEGASRDFSYLKTPRDLPKHMVVGPDGQATNLSAFKGKVVLVNFWATWCPPCVKEMPSLNNLQAKRGGEDFQVVAISVDRKREQAGRFLESKGLKHLELYTAKMGETLNAFRVGVLPTSLVISRQGKILGAIAGDAEWDGEEALELIDYFIALK